MTPFYFSQQNTDSLPLRLCSCLCSCLSVHPHQRILAELGLPSQAPPLPYNSDPALHLNRSAPNAWQAAPGPPNATSSSVSVTGYGLPAKGVSSSLAQSSLPGQAVASWATSLDTQGLCIWSPVCNTQVVSIFTRKYMNIV
jgi:hypothetical protein